MAPSFFQTVSQMTVKQDQTRFGNAARDLLLLLVASIACVVVLTAAMARGSGFQASEFGISQILLFLVLVTGLVAAAVMVRRTLRVAHDDIAQLQRDNQKLQARLDTAHSIIGAEPQVLFYWEIGGVLRVVSNTLGTTTGMPSEEKDLLEFSKWLAPSAIAAFEKHTGKLFQDGQPFNVILKTKAGGHVEAEGHARAGRAVIRLRGITGFKKDLSRIADTHDVLAREVDASRALLNALPMPAWIKDSEGRFAWVNTAFAAAVESDTSDDVIERQSELLERPQRERISSSLAPGITFRETMPIIIDGERRRHDIISVSTSGGSAGAAIDIAEIESAQGEFERRVEAYDWTLDRVETAVVIFDSSRQLAYFNPAFVALWNVDMSWLKSGMRDTDIFDRLHALDCFPAVVNYTKWRRLVLRIDGEADPAYDKLWHLPDGRLLHVTSEVRADGSMTFLFTDETEQLALKSRFNSMTRVQGETLNSLTDGVAVFATDGRLKLHNRAFASIWKLSPDMLGKEPHIDDIISITRVLFDEGQAWSDLKRSVTAFSDTRTPIAGQMARPDNSVIDYATTPLPDGATLLTFVDVTDAKRYERALVERNEALVAADRLKNKFISNVSYELRSPLTNIIGFSELLESQYMGELNDKQREYVHDIIFSSRTLLSIIDGILDLATIDAGDLELQREPLNVRETIEGSLEGLQERSARANLTFDIAVADDTKTFFADAARAKQVFYNILSNAVGFSHAGDEIRVSCYTDDGHVVFQVQDHGIGISKEAQQKVFERFVSDSQGSKHRGPGLGLSIIKSLMELHGGSVAIESEPDEGTLVTVRFPSEAHLNERARVSDKSEPEELSG